MKITDGKPLRGICVIVGVWAAGACVPVEPLTPVVRPQGSTDLVATASTDLGEVSAGMVVTLRGTVAGGTPPYLYRWDQNDGPVDLELTEVTSPILTTDPIPTAGRYVFRLVAADSTGMTATDFLAVDVGEALTVTAATNTPEIFEGMAATVTVDESGLNPPFTYTWELQSGPVELDFSEQTGSTLTTDPLTTVGEYVFVVTVTDSAGAVASASATVEVVAAVTADAPGLAVVGEPVELSATVETDAEGVTVQWDVVTGGGTFDDASSLTTMLTTEAGETVDVLLTVTLPSSGDDPVTTTREFEIVSVLDLQPQVLIETNFGDMIIELDAEQGPGHAANFLLYVDDGFYDDVVFHRAACQDDGGDACEPFVLQGGGYKRVGGELELQEATRESIASEASNGLSNGVLYTVSMALDGGDPDSAHTQFFINLTDNSFLDEQGFTVFGSVVEGTEAIEAVFDLARESNPFAGGEVSLPAEDVIMETVTRVIP